MLTKKYIVGSVMVLIIISLSVYDWFAVAQALHHTNAARLTLAQLNQQCLQSKDSDGFGSAFIGSSMIRHQSGQITVPCKIYLKHGSFLQFSDVHLRSKDLLITDAQPSEERGPSQHLPTNVVIEKSDFKGDASAFQVDLNAKGSGVKISNSNFDYSLALGVGVGFGDDDSTSILEVRKSKFVSNDPESEGITLVSVGKGTFADNEFRLSEPDDVALLLAHPCETRNNAHAGLHCNQ